MTLIKFKLAIAWKFYRDVNLSWINEDSCSTARLSWPSMNKSCTNQLLGLGRNIISITLTILTGHCVMGGHVQKWCCHLMTSSVVVIPLRKWKLLSIFSVHTHLLRGADIVYFALRPLLACQSYCLLMLKSRLSSFLAGFPAWGSCALNVQSLRWPTSSSLTWRNLVSAENAFTCVVTMGRYARSSELLL